MPDERVAAAIAHWAPRFTSQGVDMNDFQRVTGALPQSRLGVAFVFLQDLAIELFQLARLFQRDLLQGRALGVERVLDPGAALQRHAGLVWGVCRHVLSHV